MFCPKCGKENSNNTFFCSNCGYDLKSVRAAAFSRSNPVQPVNPVPTQEPTTWDGYFLNRWKDFSSSGLVLALLACVTLVQLMGTTVDPMDAVYEAMHAMEIPYYYYADAMEEISEMMDTVRIFSTVIGVLLAGSLWAMFLDARKGGPRLNTAGLTIIQGLQIIGLVGLCLVFGILLLGCFAAMSEMKGYYYEDARTGMAVVIAVIAAVFLFVVIAYARILALIKSAKSTMRTFVPTCKGAMFVGVLCILAGCVSAFGLLSNLSDGFELSMALSTASSFLYGIVAISYKGFVEELTEARSRMA